MTRNRRNNFEKLAIRRGGEDLPEREKNTHVQTMPRLEFLEQQIQGALNQLRHFKRAVLRNLYLIYQNREHYFQDRPQYQENFAHYVRDTFGQSLKTVYDDLRIIKLLTAHQCPEVLEKERGDLIYLLKRIAAVSEPRSQAILLGNIEQINRHQIEEFLEQNSPPEHASPTRKSQFRSLSGWKTAETKIDASKKTITIRLNNQQDLEMLQSLIEQLTPEKLQATLYAMEKTK